MLPVGAGLCFSITFTLVLSWLSLTLALLPSSQESRLPRGPRGRRGGPCLASVQQGCLWALSCADGVRCSCAGQGGTGQRRVDGTSLRPKSVPKESPGKKGRTEEGESSTPMMASGLGDQSAAQPDPPGPAAATLLSSWGRFPRACFPGGRSDCSERGQRQDGAAVSTPHPWGPLPAQVFVQWLTEHGGRDMEASLMLCRPPAAGTHPELVW